jgi:hypothetical protein
MNLWASTAALLLLAACAVAAAKDEGKPVLRADYENRQVTSGVPGLVADGPPARDALEVDCSVARSGSCSLVSRIRMDDSYLSAGAHRSETSTSRVPETLYSPGDRFRYRFSVQLDKDWKEDGRDAIEMLWQFKRFATHPDMFVAVKGHTIVWRIADVRQITLLDNLPVGEWVDFDFTIRWSAGDDGKAELVVTRNGQSRTFEHLGRNLRDAKPRGGYLKWGLYKPGQTKRETPFPPRSVHHDDILVERLP